MHIAIIGTGRVGAALAFHLIFESYVDRLDLVDVIPGLARSVMEDLSHAMVFGEHEVEIYAFEDSKFVSNADLIVITAGISRKPDMSRRDLIGKNILTLKTILESLVERNPRAQYLIVSNPVDALSTYTSKIVGERVFGTGTILETARMRAYLSRILKVPIYAVDGYVGGEHGESAVILWSTIKIFGSPLGGYLEERSISLDKHDVELYIKNISKEIIARQGGTIWGPAEAFLEIIRGIMLNTGKILSFSYSWSIPSLPEKVHITIPAKIGYRPGPNIWDVLSMEERQKIIFAAKNIYRTYSEGLEALSSVSN